VDLHAKFEHVFASLRHICTHKDGVSASQFYCVWGSWTRNAHMHEQRKTQACVCECVWL